MDPMKEYLKLETRRQFFGKCAMGLGGAALASLLPNSFVNALEQQAVPQTGGLPELPALRAESETRHLPIYVRCAVTDGSV